MSAPTVVQAPAAVVLVRPHHFTPNASTAADNAFQGVDQRRSAGQIAADAYLETTMVADALRDRGVVVHLFEDFDHSRPDSVFPNNWFSTHPDGRIVLYPMLSPNRRAERRSDIVGELRRLYRFTGLTDYSVLEERGLYLEGTGAMVLDHRERVAFAVRSRRADPAVLQRFCEEFGYEPFVFDAADEHRIPVYHTNVLMCVARDVALVGLDMIGSAAERHCLAARLAASGRTVVPLTAAQICEFAGNAIELQGAEGPLLAMSGRGARSLTSSQRSMIEAHLPILELEVPTIELAGGSVRCMIAGVHLQMRYE